MGPPPEHDASDLNGLVGVVLANDSAPAPTEATTTVNAGADGADEQNDKKDEKEELDHE